MLSMKSELTQMPALLLLISVFLALHLHMPIEVQSVNKWEIKVNTSEKSDFLGRRFINPNFCMSSCPVIPQKGSLPNESKIFHLILAIWGGGITASDFVNVYPAADNIS